MQAKQNKNLHTKNKLASGKNSQRKEAEMATENNLTDADYLKSPELGTVVAKGMAVMYAQNPKNPVDFLAKWLLNYAQVERAKDSQNESKRLVGEHKQAHDEKLKAD